MNINWKYAFGEILIVIIGISIAFSLNKCAETSSEKKERKQYLLNLKEDIEADKTNLEQVLTEVNAKIEKCDKILPILGNDSENKMSIIRDVFEVSVISNFDPKDITYQTLINSGDLKLIDDFNLRTEIEKHYSNNKIMFKSFERQEKIHKDYLGPYFIYNSDFDDFRKGVFGFKDEKLLKNIIQSMQGSLLIKQNAVKEGIESCDHLLETLSTHMD